MDMSEEYESEVRWVSESLKEVFRSAGCSGFHGNPCNGDNAELCVLRRCGGGGAYSSGGGAYGGGFGGGGGAGVPFSHCPVTPRFAVKVGRLTSLLRRRRTLTSLRKHAHLLLEFRRHVTCRLQSAVDRERTALARCRASTNTTTSTPTATTTATSAQNNTSTPTNPAGDIAGDGINELTDFCDSYRRHVTSWRSLKPVQDTADDLRKLLARMHQEHWDLCSQCVRRLSDLARVGFRRFAHRMHEAEAGDEPLWRVLRAVRELNSLLTSLSSGAGVNGVVGGAKGCSSSGSGVNFSIPEPITLTELLNTIAGERCNYLCYATYRLFAGQPELATVPDNDRRVWTHCQVSPTTPATTHATTHATAIHNTRVQKPSSDTSDYQSDSSPENREDLDDSDDLDPLTPLTCASLARQASHVIAASQREHYAVSRLLEVCVWRFNTPHTRTM